jgi:uncharacterized protein (TIGR02001 family)
MKFFKLALCAATATVALGGAALAADGPSVAFNVGVTSEYSFRGLSQNAKDPAVFGGADLSAGAFYAGAWASQVSFASAETDLYAGYKPTLGPVTFDLGAIYYGYVNQDLPNEAYWEGKVAASIPAGEKGTLGVAYYYSPAFFGDTSRADYYELNGSMPFPVAGATLSGAIGRQSLARKYYGVDGYSTWNAGVTFPVYKDKVSFDVRYVGTDKDAKTACVGCNLNKVFATLKATF